MQSVTELIRRLNCIMPAGVSPRFTSAEELMAWHQAEGQKQSGKIYRENQMIRMKNRLGRSGIQKLYHRCTFANYQITCRGQKNALSMAKSWLNNFGNGFASFVFSGSRGTGKNHLAVAMGNQLLEQGKEIWVITTPDLVLEARASYDRGRSELEFINELSTVDLLILDEVGIQRETTNEFVILSQIIDRRTAAMKPTGVLTNLNYAELTGVLGERAMDRLSMDGSIWVNFNWESYRSMNNK